MIDGEDWRYVPNFPEYIVSNFGVVKKIGNTVPVITRQKVKDGPLMVSLHVSREWGPREFRVDRIVAAAFLLESGNWKELLYKDVVHLDGDPKNCRIDNLDWSEYHD